MLDNAYHWQMASHHLVFCCQGKRQKRQDDMASCHTRQSLARHRFVFGQKDNQSLSLASCHLICFYAIDSIVVVDSVDIVEFVGSVGFVVVVNDSTVDFVALIVVNDSTVDFVALIDSFCCCCFN